MSMGTMKSALLVGWMEGRERFGQWVIEVNEEIKSQEEPSKFQIETGDKKETSRLQTDVKKSPQELQTFRSKSSRFNLLTLNELCTSVSSRSITRHNLLASQFVA